MDLTNFSKHKTEISIILLILSMLLIFSSCQKLTSIVRSSNAKPILKTITVSETNESEPVILWCLRMERLTYSEIHT